MEKIKINNQVVQMRKFVKQAKVHTINKLVKQIKLLQNRKGNEVQINKAKRKAERFLETVTLMKKIKPDDVSKLALSKAKDWKNELQRKNCPLHDRCIAMLANYPAVQKEVETFHIANQELVLKITDLLKQWEEKNKVSKDLPKTKKMPSVVKSNKCVEKVDLTNKKLSNDKNRLNTDITNIKFNEDINVENSLETKENDNNEKNTLQISDSHSKINNNEQEIEMNEPDKKISENMIDDDDDSENSVESEDSDNSEEEELINDVVSSDVCVTGNKNETEDQKSEDGDNNKQTLNLNFIDKQSKMKNNNENKLKAITLINLNELEGLDEIPVKNISYDEESSSEDEISETSMNKNSDPFFLEPGNKNTVDDELVIPFESNSIHPRNKNPAFKETEKKVGQRSRSQLSPKKDLKHFSSISRTISQEFKNDSNDYKSVKRGMFMPNNYNKFQDKNKSTFDRFHNKNQKSFKMYPPRDNFERKKYENISKDSHYRNESKLSISRKIPHKKDPANNKPLHPSWEAKKKQKELKNTSFQGKRIVFGD